MTHRNCVNRRCAANKKKSAKSNLEIIKAENLDRIAYWWIAWLRRSSNTYLSFFWTFLYLCAGFRIRIRIRINLSSWIRIHIQIADPDPGKNMTQKNRKKDKIFICWSAGCSLLRAEGFSCSLGILYGGLGIRKLQFLIKKIKIKFLVVNFFQF